MSAKRIHFKKMVCILIFLALPFFFSSFIALGKSQGLEIVVYVYDLSGGCSGERYNCKNEYLVDESFKYYNTLIENLDLDLDVKLNIKNMRNSQVLQELEGLDDPVVDKHLNLPYPLIFVNDVYEVNMEKSPMTFYETLLKYIDSDFDQIRIEKMLANLSKERGAYQTGDYLVYFMREDCPYCIKIEPYIEPYREEKKLLEYDLSKERNILLYKKYLEAYGYGSPKNQPSTLVPAVFVNDAYLRGSLRVSDYLSIVCNDTKLETIMIE